MSKKVIGIVLGLCVMSYVLSGCETSEQYERLRREYSNYQQNMVRENVIKDDIIKKLRAELADTQQALADLRDEKAEKVELLIAKDAHISSLEEAQRRLAESLKNELRDYQAKLEMTERGLVLTFLAEIFFDPGKDVVREESKGTLQKVATVLNRDVLTSSVAIEGHTDSDPIKYSSWKSNWELSAARALAVLHYFTDEGNVASERLSVVGFGEFQPVASNDTAEGKKKNRRVEIVILPENLKKQK